MQQRGWRKNKMFKFLKEKIRESISKISDKIEQEAPEEEIEREIPVKEEKAQEKSAEKKETAAEGLATMAEKPAGGQEQAPGEKKEGLFGRFKKIFKREGKAEAKEEAEEEKTPKQKKEEGEKFLQQIKEELTKQELEQQKQEEEERKKQEEQRKKEEIEKRIQEKVKAGQAPSLRDLLARREIEKPKKEVKVQKPAIPSQEIQAEKKKEEQQKEQELIKAIAAGKKIEEVKKPEEMEEAAEKPKEAQKPSEEDLIKSIAFGKKIEAAPSVPEEKAEEAEEAEEKAEEPEKKGFFARLKERIVTKKISEKQFDELFWELEVVLLENNVAVEVIEKIKNDLKKDLTQKPVLRNKVNDAVVKSLKDSIAGLFDIEKIDLFQRMEKKKPLVICFIGVNGSGKTTTIAKIAALLQQYKFSSVIAASDTFRAAAINQLEEHANKLGVKLIKHDYGADPAAVAFDAVKYAESKGIDAVLIDTAGRLHSNVNLMDEMKKIVRVTKPDLKIFIGESITGNDCIEQAKQFNEAIGIDGIILSKADVDEKGGAAISVSYVTKKPIMYIGTGQRYEDLEEFDSEKIIKSLGL
jgi:fused signal recognition particle receptor